MIHIEIVLRAQNQMTHDPERRIAVLIQDFGEGHCAVGEPGPKRRDGVAARIQPSDHRGHRGHGPRSGGVHSLESMALGGQRIDEGRCVSRHAVAPEMVPSQRVDHDQQHVRPALRRCLGIGLDT